MFFTFYKNIYKNVYKNVTNYIHKITYHFYFLFSLLYLYINLSLYGLDKNKDLILNILKNNGPLFIKIGQNLMNKSFLSDDFKNEFKKLGYNNYSKTRIKNIVDSDFTYYIFNKNPIAAGSIAQIWEGLYINNELQEERIIIKKLHDNIKEKTILSINMFKLLNKYFKYFDLFNKIDLLLEFDELYIDLYNQINLINEVNSLNKLKDIFKNHTDIIVFPHVYKYNEEYIIEKYEDGYTLNEFIKLYPDKNKEILALLYTCIYMMFFNNFSHGDFHESNFLLRLNDKNQVQIVLFDFGITYSLDNKSINKFIGLFQNNLFILDFNKLIKLLILENINSNANIDNFIIDCDIYLNKYDFYNKTVKCLNNEWISTDDTFDASKIINDLLNISTDNHLKFRGNILNICNSLIILNDYQHLCVGYECHWNFILDYIKTNNFYDELYNKFMNDSDDDE